MAMRGNRPFWLRPGCIGGILLAVVIVVGVTWVYLSVYQGRNISRITGIPTKIELPECITSRDQIISISFHSKLGGETIKDVTYECEGRIYSHEYNDFGIFQGAIEWTIKQQ